MFAVYAVGLDVVVVAFLLSASHMGTTNYAFRKISGWNEENTLLLIYSAPVGVYTVFRIYFWLCCKSSDAVARKGGSGKIIQSGLIECHLY